MPLASSNLPLASSNLPFTASTFPLASSNLPLASSNLPLASSNLPFTASFFLFAASFTLEALSFKAPKSFLDFSMLFMKEALFLYAKRKIINKNLHIFLEYLIFLSMTNINSIQK